MLGEEQLLPAAVRILPNTKVKSFPENNNPCDDNYKKISPQIC
jgi:hypothetical protein